MQEFFDPETMLLSDEFLHRYEEALAKLPKRALYVWLLYRKGGSAREIASILIRRDKKRLSKRRHEAYRKRVGRMLIEVQRELKKQCIGKKCGITNKKNNEGSCIAKEQ